MVPDNSTIRIAIVGSHGLIREGLCRILMREECFDIVAECANSIQMIDMIGKLRPDVAILDWTMSPLDPFEIITSIKQRSSATNTLMITLNGHENTILSGLKAGAKGYLSEESNGSALIKSVKTVHKGDLWVERKLVGKIINGVESSAFENTQQEKLIPNILTAREQDVLVILVRGLSNKEIAQELYISEKTVKSHLSKIFRKLDVGCRLEAILFALKSGFS